MGKNILVVEDDPSVQMLYHDELVDEGYEVHLADDGLKALKLFEKEKIDLVITDIRLPLINGTIMITLMTAHRPDIPIIVVSAMKQSGKYEKYVVKYYDKPVNLQVLKAKVREVLDGRAGA